MSNEQPQSPMSESQEVKTGGGRRIRMWLGLALLLALGGFVGGFALGYSQVRELESLMATQTSQFEADLAEAEHAAASAATAQTDAELRANMLQARQRLAQATLELSTQNFGTARGRLEEARALLEAAPEPFHALASDAQLDIVATGDSAQELADLQRLSATLDEAVEALE